MSRLLSFALLTSVLVSFGSLPVTAQLLTPRGPVREGPKKSVFEQCNRASLVFSGEIGSVKQGPTARSFPPIYTFTLTFAKNDEPLRGEMPSDVEFHYSIRTQQQPTIIVGDEYILAVRTTAEGKHVIESLLPATKENLKIASEAATVPLGWSYVEGKPVSPWARFKDANWPKDAATGEGLACSKTGRPVLWAGQRIQMSVKQVPPAKLQKFRNPYGDGQFELTLTNTGKMAVDVDALLQQDGKTRWEESIVVICQGKPYLLPQGKPLTNPTPTSLAPGESVSTVIDTLLLDGDIPWPRGGSRIHFTFAVGEVAADNFFYYFSQLHDPMRAERRKTE